jgi:hypothetical protein
MRLRPQPHLPFWMISIGAMCLCLGACDRDQPKPADKGRNAGVTATSTSGSALSTIVEAGVDKKDDPKYPRALPKTNEVRGWIKTQPIRMAPATRLDELVEDAGKRTAIARFRTKWAARCRYDQQNTSADVLFLQMVTPQDAFGLFSVMTPEPGELVPADRSVRAVEQTDAVLRLTAQQGNVFLTITFRGRVDFEPVRVTCQKLFDFVVFNLPAAEEPPLLLQLVPDNQRAATKVWVVRDLGALSHVDNPILHGLNVSEMNARLGLSGDVFLSLAALGATAASPGPETRPAAKARPGPDTKPVRDAKPGDLIWLAQYPNAETAKAVYERYLAAIQNQPDDLDKRTILMPPRGVYLAGAWTQEPQTTPSLLSQLQDALPTQ